MKYTTVFFYIMNHNEVIFLLKKVLTSVSQVAVVDGEGEVGQGHVKVVIALPLCLANLLQASHEVDLGGLERRR